MRLSINEQRELDTFVKELKIRRGCLDEGLYMLNPDVRDYLKVVSDVILYLERKMEGR